MLQCCKRSADYANFWKKHWFIGTICCIGLIRNEKITRLACKPYINQVSYVSKSEDVPRRHKEHVCPSQMNEFLKLRKHS